MNIELFLIEQICFALNYVCVALSKNDCAKNIFNLISKHEKKLVIFSSHDWTLMKRIADQVIYLPLGDRAIIDSPNNIYNQHCI